MAARVLNVLASTGYPPLAVAGSFMPLRYPLVHKSLVITVDIPAHNDGLGRAWAEG
jgi:hypothetical protein